MLGMFALILLTFAIANVQSFLWVNSKWLVSTVLPAVVVTETNEARKNEDLPPLVRSDVLDQAAQLKAEDMAAHGYFAHKSPDGITPWHWFREAGYQYVYAGENLAVHFTDSTTVVDAWLKSPTHRANVMNADYTEIGIGTAKGSYEGFNTVFVVQLFGTPAIVEPTPITPTIEIKEFTVPEAEPVAVASIAESEPAETEIESEIHTSVTDSGTVVYESYMATATPGAVLAETTASPSVNTDASFFARLVTSPSAVIQIIYSVIGLLVMGLLFYTLIFEWRHHHPIQTAYSIGLLVVMIGLFMLHATLTGGVVT